MKKKFAIFFSLFVVLLLGLFYTLQKGWLKSKSPVFKKRQIILISLDALRADHLPVYGYSRNTSPFLSQLAQSATLFRHAYTNGCWTMPSHMTMLTGTLPSRHGINLDWPTYYIEKKYPILSGSIQTMAEILLRGKFHTVKVARLPDELGFGRGFSTNQNLDPFQTEERFLKLLQQLTDIKDKDFFMFIHTWMIHSPYSSTHFLKDETKARLGEKKLGFIDDFRNRVTEKFTFPTHIKEFGIYNLQNCIDLYDGGIYRVDQLIKRLVKKCQELGIFQDLTLVIVSDHGEHFGERDINRFYDQHGWDYFEEFIKVPLLIKFPRQTQAKSVDTLVSLIDLMPTVLACYQLDIPHYVQGDSLLNPSAQNFIISEATSTSGYLEKKMIRVKNLKYIVTMANAVNRGRVNWSKILERRLFDLEADPEERKNLFSHIKHKRTAFHFEKMLVRLLKDSVAIGKTNKRTAIKEKNIRLLKSLGYL